MALTLSIAAATVVAMIFSVLFKPYVCIKGIKLGLYWIICFVGAILMIATGCISFSSVVSGITAKSSVNPLKILTLFLAMTLISVYLGDAGFFDYVADTVFLKSKGGQMRLFLLLFAVVSVLTIFTSNDVIILTFTPPICIFAKKAKISPIPYLFGEFVAANTWSMALVVGNPTNVYLAESAGISFIGYLSVMWLPALLGGLTGLVVLLFLFRKSLHAPIKNDLDKIGVGAPHGHVKIQKIPMIASIFHLVLCIVLLALSDLVGIEMWLICLVLALSLTVFDCVYDLISFHSAKPVWRSIKKEPYELIPFVLSMFVIVLALKNCGFTELLSNALIKGNGADGAVFGILSALSANLLNNIPMSVLFERIIAGKSNFAIFGAIIGSNIGAFITPVGALAGIMWNKILNNHGVKLPFYKFVLYGTAVAIPSLLASILGLVVVL